MARVKRFELARVLSPSVTLGLVPTVRPSAARFWCMTTREEAEPLTLARSPRVKNLEVKCIRLGPASAEISGESSHPAQQLGQQQAFAAAR